MDPLTRRSRMLSTLLLVAAVAHGDLLPSFAPVVNTGCQKYSNSLTCENSDLVDLNEVKRWGIHDVIHLSVAYNQLTRVDHGSLITATNMTTLILHHNFITHINITSICTMEKLKHLDLSFNRLKELKIPENCNFSLLTLNISNNLLNRFSVAPNSGPKSTLAYLNLENNSLQNNIHFLNNLRALRKLTLSSNGISKIDYEIFSVNHNFLYLQHLYMNDNNITDVTFLKNLSILYNLNLSNNSISVIPENTFLNHTLLVNLNLSFNAIMDVRFLVNLMNKKELKILDMSHNKINYIDPTYVAENKISLRSLNVSHNNLTSVSFVRDIKTMTTFRADFNRISFVNVAESKLKKLSLSHNKISDITFLNVLQQLRELNISFNSITKTHNIFNNMKELKSLDISHNHLSEFESTPLAETLTFLNISFNKIHRIPCSKSLESLDLDNNKLTNLDISCLPNLRRLTALEVVVENRQRYRLQEAWVLEMKINNSVMKCHPPMSTVLTCKEVCEVTGRESLFCADSAADLISYSVLGVCVLVCVACLCIGIRFYRLKAKRSNIINCTCIGRSNEQYQYVRSVDDIGD